MEGEGVEEEGGWRVKGWRMEGRVEGEGMEDGGEEAHSSAAAVHAEQAQLQGSACSVT